MAFFNGAFSARIKCFYGPTETQNYATAKAARPFTSDTIVWLGKHAEFTSKQSLFTIQALTPILDTDPDPGLVLTLATHFTIGAYRNTTNCIYSIYSNVEAMHEVKWPKLEPTPKNRISFLAPDSYLNSNPKNNLPWLCSLSMSLFTIFVKIFRAGGDLSAYASKKETISSVL